MIQSKKSVNCLHYGLVYLRNRLDVSVVIKKTNSPDKMRC